MKILLLLALAVSYTSINTQTPGTLTDSRDGQEYRTVTYEIKLKDKTKTTMTWMAENLNFETENSYCYDDYASNCKIMGRLYIWSAAMKACTKGWHLPDDEEWNQLADLFGEVELAAKHLKSTSELWEGATQGTNKSLFNAMLYGHAFLLIYSRRLNYISPGII